MKGMKLEAVIITAVIIFVVTLGGGILTGFFIKKHKEKVNATPVISITDVKILKENNTPEVTYYSVEGITATTKSGDPVAITLHNGSVCITADKNGKFSAVPSNESGKYTVSAKNTNKGIEAESKVISGFDRLEWDPLTIPSLDITRRNVALTMEAKSYHYKLTGVKVNVTKGANVELVLEDKTSGKVFKGVFNKANGLWYVDRIPGVASGKYLLYARNLTEGTVSEKMEVGGFNLLKKINTPTAAQLLKMYKDGDHKRYQKAFKKGYKFVFSGDPIKGLRPSTNQEICTMLMIYAWKDITIVKIETDCLGYITKVHIKVKTN